MYLIEYKYLGKTYSFSLEADSWQDAENKIKRMRSLTVVGSDYEVIEANSLTAPLVAIWIRIKAWWKNF